MKNSEKKKATRPQKTKTPQTIIYVPPTLGRIGGKAEEVKREWNEGLQCHIVTVKISGELLELKWEGYLAEKQSILKNAYGETNAQLMNSGGAPVKRMPEGFSAAEIRAHIEAEEPDDEEASGEPAEEDEPSDRELDIENIPDPDAFLDEDDE